MRRGIVPLFLLFSLVLPYVAGPAGAYISSCLILLIVAWHFTQPNPLVEDIGGTMAALAVLILLVIFWITNPPGRTDYLFAVNFAIFLFILPLSSALSRLATPRNVMIFARLALAGALLACTLALWQRYGLHRSRAEGFNSGPIAATAAAIVLGFLATVGFTQSTSRGRWIYLLGPLAGLVVIWLSGSRGPLLALPGLLLVFLFFGLRSWKLAVGVTVIVAALAAVTFIFFSTYLGRFASLPSVLVSVLFDQDMQAGSSGSKRMIILRASLKAFVNSPFVGYGWGEKNAVVRFFSNDAIHLTKRLRNHLHSDLLNFGVSGGIAGLVAYALIVLAPVISAWRSVRDSQYRSRLTAALLLAVGFAGCGTVNLVFGFEYLTTLYACLSAIVIGFCRDEPMMMVRPTSSRSP